MHCKSGGKLVRLSALLSEAIRVIEEECLNGKSLKGTYLQQEIGITDDEYDEDL